MNEKIQEQKDMPVRAAMSWNPIFGIVDGIVSGKPERMIPGYGLVEAIDSALTGRLENLQKQKSNLRQQLNEHRDNKSRLGSEINNTESRINDYIQKIYITDKEIENCARKIRKYSENLTTQSQLKSQLEIMLVNLQSYSKKLMQLNKLQRNERKTITKRINTIQADFISLRSQLQIL